MKISINEFLKSVLYFLDRTLAPPVCPFCRQEPLPPKSACCPNCRKKIRTFGDKKRCRGCGGINDGYLDLCSECCEHESWPWHQAVSAFPYSSLIREAMIQYKYMGRTYFLPFLAGETALAWRQHGPPVLPDLITAVPMHWFRQMQRGYNQAELLAREIGKILNIPYAEILSRTKFTPRQAKLNKEQRLKNLKKAFRCRNRKLIRNKTILLVDDVFTTGSTLTECSRVLLQAEAAEIYVLTVARDE